MRKLAAGSFAFLFLLAYVVSASPAAAATTYLRPDKDRSTSGWNIVGAPTASQALADPVTPSEIPSATSYVQTKCSFGCSLETLSVDLDTASLAGLTNVAVTAWFYTPDSSPVQMEARRAGVFVLGSVESKKAGWHSASVSLTKQAHLDDLSLHFKKGFSGSTGPRIYSAFVQLTYTPPSTSIYWGSWIDGDVYTKAGEEPWGDAPWSNQTWDEFEANSGGKPLSILHFGQPAPWNQSFAEGPLDLTIERGAIPMMDMDPDGVTLSSINSGAKDADFQAWAAAVSEYGKPFFLRWSWEMNGQWFKPYGPESAASPELYKQVWRRIHGIATEHGAHNITWVWCPNVTVEGTTPISQLYPGDAYVDWTCMDGYNRGSNPINPEGSKSFSGVFSQTYQELLSIAPSKPIMIGEVGATEVDLFRKKRDWIAEALGSELPTNFPKIEAVLWFNWNHPEPTGERWDWQIESSPAAEASFRNVISSPFYAANAFGSLPPLTKIQPLP
ncbi:MAG TPA: glycosyl hydrolase [Solirubrobacterales bacterium]|nr:glycosyl hydrolase [Solirubrobacterales bacterium]